MARSTQKPIDIGKLDKKMAPDPLTTDGLKWFMPGRKPFRLAGFAWFKQDKVYRRLPVNPKEKIPGAVDSLANCTAGGQIQFLSNSKRVAVHVKLPAPANMVHMPATGQCGFDLYIGTPGRQLYYSTTKYDVTQSEYKVLMFEHKKAEMRNFTLNFPLYSGVNEVLVGLEPKARIQPPPPYTINKPIVIYGTSITQGGCACRPGMAYTNILSRRLNMPVINLGFSGNGKGEPELASTINEIRNPSLLVLDYDANCVGNDNLARTLPEFIRILRTVNKHAPILVITRIPPASELVQETAARARRERIEIQRDIVTRLQKAGDKRLFFQDGSSLLGDDWHESTVDGSHPTDLGFQRIADHLEPVMRRILFGR